jgi:tRNA uracil 4-sulfurtransferase
VDALVAHYHEIGLKGRNRSFFEDALTRNLRRALRGTRYARIRKGFGRVVVDLKRDALVEEAAERAARVFGIAYLGVGRRVEPDLDRIAEVALEMMAPGTFSSFAVRARRTHAAVAQRSNEINTIVGQKIKDATNAKVDLKQPDATLHIELFGGACIVFRERREGQGGLPTGTSGRLLALQSGGIDSPVAAWRMMRRGAEVELVHFHGQPYTDPSSVRQTIELAEILTRFHLRTTLHLIPLADAQRDIVMQAPADMRIVLYRRAMMRIAAALAAEREAQGIVTGDSLGQVASQTIENIAATSSAIRGIEILRPLVGMDKQEIIDNAIRIGTYEISTRKYQDCCVLFEPRSPATKVPVAKAEEAEEGLDMEAMIGKALAGIETRVLELPDP